MPFIVLYDANVLYPSILRDLLLRVAQAGLVQAKWSERILDEVVRSLTRNRPDLNPVSLDRTRSLMNAAIRDVLVTGFEPLIELIRLPDPDDRHVLAAAIKARAQVIVTYNVKHFPPVELVKWGIEARHPDDFLVDQFHLDSITVHSAVQRIADSYRNPAMTATDVCNALERSGALQLSALLRR